MFLKLTAGGRSVRLPEIFIRLALQATGGGCSFIHFWIGGFQVDIGFTRNAAPSPAGVDHHQLARLTPAFQPSSADDPDADFRRLVINITSSQPHIARRSAGSYGRVTETAARRTSVHHADIQLPAIGRGQALICGPYPDCSARRAVAVAPARIISIPLLQPSVPASFIPAAESPGSFR